MRLSWDAYLEPATLPKLLLCEVVIDATVDPLTAPDPYQGVRAQAMGFGVDPSRAGNWSVDEAKWSVWDAGTTRLFLQASVSGQPVAPHGLMSFLLLVESLLMRVGSGRVADVLTQCPHGSAVPRRDLALSTLGLAWPTAGPRCGAVSGGAPARAVPD